MDDCVWNVNPEDRKCIYCSFRGGCAMYPTADGLKRGWSPDLKVYQDVMSGLIGDDVMKKSRKADLVYGRYIIAYQLSMDGYCNTAIGRMLGLHHATVMYALEKINMLLSMPGMFTEECKLLNNFKNLIKDVK